MEIQDIKRMLQLQFGPFIRESTYQSSFEKSLKLLDTIERQNPEPIPIDVFYFFLHSLIVELFSEIESLRKQLKALTPPTERES